MTISTTIIYGLQKLYLILKFNKNLISVLLKYIFTHHPQNVKI